MNIRSVSVSAAVLVLAMWASAPLAEEADKKNLRCKTVMAEVEGFFHDSIVWASEKSRKRAIAAEKSRRRALGQKVVKVEMHDTVCKETYPIGLKEWHCISKADVCVEK